MGAPKNLIFDHFYVTNQCGILVGPGGTHEMAQRAFLAEKIQKNFFTKNWQKIISQRGAFQTYLVTMSVPLGRKGLPTIASKTELFPALWLPIVTILGK